MKRSWGKKAVSYITLCFMMLIVVPSTVYAEEPESPGAPTLTYESTLIPLADLKLQLDLPDFTLNASTCAGCTVTPIPAGAYPTLGEGIFLNKEAAASFLAWQSFVQSRFDYELDYAMGRVRNADVLSMRMLEDQARTRQQLDALRIAEVTAQRDIALEAAKRRWYEHPAFVATISIVATSALAIGLNYGLSETR